MNIFDENTKKSKQIKKLLKEIMYFLIFRLN